MMDPQRRLVYQFVELPRVVQLDIVTRLNLVDENDSQLGDHDLNVEYFRRVSRGGILAEFREAVEREHDKLYERR